MDREIKKRIKEYANKEIDYIVGKRIVGQNRELLKQVIILGELLNRFCFLESSQHLFAAKNCMVRDLIKGESTEYLTPTLPTRDE
jgi:hypothetical protein